MAKDETTQSGKQQGIHEGRQDRAQDDTAKQRPGLEDQKLREAHERGPRSGQDEAAQDDNN
ncbi:MULTISPECIES: hypothetical protein [Xanthomonas]|uniref:General stress protein n=1 Tax=Xanthomonas rydalmerensis TaxID=3046274 RepID=A0ABZ0JI82_9XANT|nr:MULTISPECIES: hypothetical protein [unclassified Xanthomonas]MBB5940870.1 hypothetical protein [Xanthomonas sp. 3307]WOS39518.1 hypothetical protein QN243_13905 [Xanthomonas sp. DM-2023]WOS43702.1 hypothetical protein QN242_13905 [Xanthomonas sp. DM-2023]WOS47883.1 hypothetical protein QN240_13905 [Xanthomonas sp. DM-2023]WOS52061.1 hypothetical protein QN244_13905 [Xanthomonas sp. DM-2023]